MIYFTIPSMAARCRTSPSSTRPSFRTRPGGSRCRDVDDKEKKRQKALKEEFKDFTKWWKDVLPSEDVESVKVSNRLVTTVLRGHQQVRLVREHGAHHEGAGTQRRPRVLHARQEDPRDQPQAPLIKTLRDRAAAEPEDERQGSRHRALRDGDARERIHLRHPRGFRALLFKLVRKNGVPDDAAVEEDDDVEGTRRPRKRRPRGGAKDEL